MPKTDGFLHGVPCWVDLLATDLDAAKDFYAGLFGWECVGVEMPRGTYWMGTISGETVAGLAAQTPQLVAQGIPSMWNTYISVKSANDTTAKAQAAGATVIQGPMDIPDAGRMAFIADPVGAAFGIWQAGEHKGAGFVKEHGTLIWSEVYAADTEAAVAFYGEVFGREREACRCQAAAATRRSSSMMSLSAARCLHRWSKCRCTGMSGSAATTPK